MRAFFGAGKEASARVLAAVRRRSGAGGGCGGVALTEQARRTGRRPVAIGAARALIEAAQLVSAGGLDLDATLDALVDQVRRVFGVPDVTINLADAATGEFLRRRASMLVDPDSDETVIGVPVELSAAAREAVGGRQPVLVEDFQNDPRVNPSSRESLPGVTGQLIVPLVDADEVVGLMVLRWEDRRRLGPADVELAGALGHHAAVAIRSARLHAELQRIEERYRLVSEASRATVWEWHPASGRVLWQGAGPAAFGYTGAAGDHVDWWHALVHPDDFDRMRDTAALALAAQAPFYESEFRLQRADGTYAWCRSSGWPRLAVGATTLRVLGVLMDVSAQRSAEDERDRLAEVLARLAERERVAMDLHDGAIQQLFGANMALAAVARSRPVDPTEAIGEARAVVADVGSSLRQYMESLVTPTAGASLTETVAWAVDGLADAAGARLETRVDPAAAARLATGAAEHLGYTVREAVSNALRHGHARNVAVEIGRTDGGMVLTVRDDGVGFRRPGLGRGRGLTNMRRRAALVGGRLTVRSRPGGGTTVRLAVPDAAIGAS